MDTEIQDSVPLIQDSQSAERGRAPSFRDIQCVEQLDTVPSLQDCQFPEPMAAATTANTESQSEVDQLISELVPLASVARVNQIDSEFQPCPSEAHPADVSILVSVLEPGYGKPDHSQIELQPWSSETSPYKYDGIKARIEHLRECDNPVDVDIECSKYHWSELTSASSDDEDLCDSNREVFERLKKDPKFAQFFGSDLSQLKLGRKFAEGGQAELFEAILPSTSKDKTKYAVKVFKKGYSLRHLYRQWPQGMLRSSEGFRLTGAIRIEGGVVFDDDRFGFVFPRYWGDLRTLMDMRMAQASNHTRSIGPFVEVDAVNILHRIALGMKGLHNQGILHRDLKAANVLIFLSDDVKPNAGSLFVDKTSSVVSVADYECSGGVVGTGFWRAPEILQQLKDRNLKEDCNLVCFSAEADVYSFGMVCYEVLTGCMPFEGRKVVDYDCVLQGNRPRLWHIGLPSWAEDLLQRCWENDASKRPTFDTLEAELGQIKLHTVYFYSELFWSVYRGVCDVVQENKLRFFSVLFVISMIFIFYNYFYIWMKI